MVPTPRRKPTVPRQAARRDTVQGQEVDIGMARRRAAFT